MAKLKKVEVKKSYMNYLLLAVGSIILAFSVTAILIPNNLVTGGITGISILLNGFLGLPYTIYYYILALLVLLSTYIFLGKAEVMKILLYGISYPIVLIGFEALSFELLLDDMFLSAIFYGVVAGVGMGLVITGGFSTGGTDTIAKIINLRLFPFIGVSKILLFIDVTIVCFSIIVYDLNTALYALVTLFVFSKSMESVVYGFTAKKVKLEIISDFSAEVENYILNTLIRGVSKYKIEGGFSKREKTVLTTICSPRESIMIKHYVAEVDPNAFIDVLPVSSVWGNGAGFEPLRDEKNRAR